MAGNLVPLNKPDRTSYFSNRNFLRKSAKEYTLYGVTIKTLDGEGRREGEGDGGGRGREREGGVVIASKSNIWTLVSSDLATP